MVSMDGSSILARTERLRREIELIEQEERVYQKMKHHSRADIMGHATRELRLAEIKAELESLQNRREP